ncbi:MAG: leucine-rich repeat domain-containing protein, partial [Muribaculaceae bacterium]|nr:leucine-rich repeat domain-containing protein [Muribaculaceae bacterium]
EGVLYEGPIAVEDDCEFRFVARHTGYNDSPVGEFIFRISEYRLPKPVITPDYLQGVLTIKADLSDRLVADGLNIDIVGGEWTEYGTEWSIEIPREAMPESVHVYAVSHNPDLYDSESVVFQPEYYGQPKLIHDGYSLRPDPETDTDPETDMIEVTASTWPGLDGILSINSDMPVAIPALFEMTVRCVGNEKFPSTDKQFANTAYFDYQAEQNDMPTVGSLYPDALPDAFNFMSNDELLDVTELRIATEISTESLEFVTDNLSNLTELDLEVTGLTALSDGAFSRLKRLTVLTLPSALTESSAALDGAECLTTLRWKEPMRAIPNGVLSSAVNPNLLVWVANESQATGLNHNVIETASGAPRAKLLMITEGYPFSTTDAFTASEAIFSREFTQITPAPGEDQGSGWETIALPFDVTEITHESKGTLIPFAIYDGNRSPEAPKPFWLYEAHTDDTWREADAIRAGVPYIISMPNHKYYAEEFRLSGKVTFRGKEVEVTPQGCDGTSVKRPDGYEFYPVFMPLEDDMYDMALGIKALGINAGRDDTEDSMGNILLPGSAFVDAVKPLPMQAYMKSLNGERYMPVFGDDSLIGALLADESLIIETGNGTIRLFSGSDRTVAVFTTTGICIATVELHDAVPITIDNLTPGIYIVGGRKVIVN